METASEWETDDHVASNGASATPNLAPGRPGGSSVVRMGTNNMVVSSSINRDALGSTSAHHSKKWDTPRRPGGVAGSAFGATPRRNRWDVSQGAAGATPGGIGAGFGATPSRFSSLKQAAAEGTPSRFSVATPMRG